MTAVTMLASMLTVQTFAERINHVQKNFATSVKVYSMLGKEVLSLGKNTTYFEAAKICTQSLPTGRYVINIRANGYDQSSVISVR